MKFALIGYGRMGGEIELQASRRGHRLVAIVDPVAEALDGRPRIGLEELAGAGADVAFEFSRPETAEANVVGAIEQGVPVVCGTTGWTPSARVEETVSRTNGKAVVAANFSVGMNLFYRVVETAATLFAAAGLHDPYVWEMHHAGKLDAPSGTALRLARSVVRADPRKETIQTGNPEGAIDSRAVHVASVRAGAEPGAHVVGFDGEYDAIRLEHRARGRSAFALGAVLAGEWLTANGNPGLHGFDVVLDSLTADGP